MIPLEESLNELPIDQLMARQDAQIRRWRRKRENRCDYCGRFFAWKDLTIVSFTPDTHFTCEETVRACTGCDK